MGGFMRINNSVFRVTGIILLTCFLHMIIFPGLSTAQAPECPYDRANPSLDHARISFKSLDYRCAEQEIEDFLKLTDISTEERADAHVLLAAVYYAKSKNEGEKRELVIEQFKEAFRAYREWRGELDISSSEFIDMMNEAKKQVDQEEEEEVIAEPVIEEKTPTTTTYEEKKPWYTKWWAIGLGVGLVAGAVVVLGGGGDDDGGDGGGAVTDTLPGFPTTPPE
jgi:hypothetical protein